MLFEPAEGLDALRSGPAGPRGAGVMMAGAVHSSRSRLELTFGFHGLGSREETLFKSFLRLLDHRLEHHWTFLDSPEADLVVAAPGQLGLALNRTTLTLVAAPMPAPRGNHLSLPIHADALETELNLLGTLIQGRRTGSDAPVYEASPTAVSLMRWPPAPLLASRERLRLAALMIGHPMTLARLRQLSGIDERTCRDFFDELQRAGLLHQRPAEPELADEPKSADPVFPAQSGLLARIRMRLGLSFAAHS